MKNDFLLYGANGFVGSVIARRAVDYGLRPLLAGRSGQAVKKQANQLGLEYAIFKLEDKAALAEALGQVPAVLHCAGPYIHTFEPMIEACLRQRVHYLDITGEVPVLQELHNRDQQAKERGVMILPAVGFDVVPTDCLALHLKRRLPTASRLTLAFHGQGPAGMPPGTAKTLIEMLPYGIRIRRGGRLAPAPNLDTREIDFGNGSRRAARITWGDLFTAHLSTGIANIENYIVLPAPLIKLMAAAQKLKGLFRIPIVKIMAGAALPAGSTADERRQSQTYVWGEVTDGAGGRAVSRLHGPEAGVEWTAEAALSALNKTLDGAGQPGFQTPAGVFGPDFVFAVDGVSREDLPVTGPSESRRL